MHNPNLNPNSFCRGRCFYDVTMWHAYHGDRFVMVMGVLIVMVMVIVVVVVMNMIILMAMAGVSVVNGWFF